MEQVNAQILKNDITINFGDNVYSTSEIINSYPWALVGVEAKATFEGTTGGIDTYNNITKTQFNANNCYSQSVTVGDMKARGDRPAAVAGTLVINGGTYMSPATVIYVTNGTCVINGGFFFGQPSSDQRSQSPEETEKNDGFPYRNFLLNCYDANYKNGTAHIYVTGGTFAGFDPADNYAEANGTNFVCTGYKSVKLEDKYKYMVKDTNRADNGTLVEVSMYEVVPADDPREGIAGTLTLPAEFQQAGE